MIVPNSLDSGPAAGGSTRDDCVSLGVSDTPRETQSDTPRETQSPCRIHVLLGGGCRLHTLYDVVYSLNSRLESNKEEEEEGSQPVKHDRDAPEGEVRETYGPYRGTSPIRKRPPPWDPPRTLGIGLR